MQKSKIQSFAIFLVFLFAAVLSAQTNVRGPVSGVWTQEGSPYVAVDDIQIANEDTLIIESGVQVHFSEDLDFTIYGHIEAHGSEEDSVFFRPIPGEEGWDGMRIIEPDSCVFNYCVFMGGARGQGGGEFDPNSAGGNIFIAEGTVFLSNCRVSQGRAAGIGGGIAIWEATPVISNCLINENYSHFVGGGVAIFRMANFSMQNCSFIENIAVEAGGGAFIGDHSNPVMESCDFIDNSVNGRNGGGGAVYINQQSNPIILDCSFIRNTTTGEGSDGGAIAVRNASSPRIGSSYFEENESSDSGGCMYLRGEGADPIVEHCTFVRNTITGGDRTGGAIYIREGSGAEVRYNRFFNNVADYGGALHVKEPPECRIHHNLFKGNGSREGGGAISTSDDLGDEPLVIVNCTFVNQTFTGLDPVPLTANPLGESRILFSSCIIWDAQPQFNEPELISVEFSQIFEGFEGEGNSEEFPMFFKHDSTWFVLNGESPCIDTGNPDLPNDPDDTQNDRGWMYFPQNALEGLEADTLVSELTVVDRDTVVLRFENQTEAPLFLSPMDFFCEGIRDAFIDVTDLIGDGEIHGAAYTSRGFVLSGGNNGRQPNKIYHLDDNFNLRGHFDQPGEPGGIGFIGLASDNDQIVYGGNNQEVIEFTANGELGETYEVQFAANPRLRYIKYLAADFSNEFGLAEFYLAGDEGFIMHTDGDFWEIDRFFAGDSIRGIGKKQNSKALYVITELENGINLLNLILPETQEIIPLYEIRTPDNYRIGGIEVTQNFEEGYGSLVGIFKGEGDDGDKLFIEKLYTSWLVIVPELKQVLPGETVEWEIVFAGDQMQPSVYNSSFTLMVNGVGEDCNVYAQMDLRPESAQTEETTPASSFSLSPVYPNPFNSTGSFHYNLPVGGRVLANLYDLEGRLVKRLTDENMRAGVHVGSIDGRFLPSGNYILKLRTNNQTLAQPVVLIK